MRLSLALYLPSPPTHTHTNYNEKLCSGVASLSRCLNVELILLVLVNHSALCSAGEEVEITYSYWDGSGHRRHVKVSASLVHLQLGFVMKTDLEMGLLIFKFAFSS